ncbi:MAG: GDP-mannose 4,6-dehydratase [Clostridia bacterium]|nr:GDP-mannose 4,6-dehydratase [Clostridia bacterium]
MKSALITGITGQDGSFLAELLLKKGYKVFGLIRRNSSDDLGNVKHLSEDIEFIYGDMTDASSLRNAVRKSNPDEVYNLAAQSFVKLSWSQPVFTTEVNAVGVLKLLDAIKDIKPSARFYQASTSEMFGLVQETPQTENTPFYPRSPYGVSKLYGHWITVNYKESYDMFCSEGILFNHESERRKAEFVTRKITSAAAAISNGLQDKLYLGNLDSERDWGYAGDYVEAMWLMLQQDKPDSYVIASGEKHSVREFASLAFEKAGMPLLWEGKGVNEKGICKNTGKTVIEVSPEFFRPADVVTLLGNPEKAEKELNWKRKITFDSLVEIMLRHDLSLINQI